MISQYFDVSTAHLSHQTINVWANTRKDGRFPDPVIAVYPEGIFVYQTEYLEELPEDLKIVLEWVREKAPHASIIRFDADGFDYEELPAYEW